MSPPDKTKEVKKPSGAETEKPDDDFVFEKYVLGDEKKPTAKSDAEKKVDVAQTDGAKKDAGEQKRDQNRPATPEDIDQLKKRVEEADKLDGKKAISGVLDAQTHSIELLDVLMRPSQKKDPEKVKALTSVFEAMEIKGWENYLTYLAPGSARAELALAQISTGDDAQIREGEKTLIEAVKLRPELAMNPQFQERVLDAYRLMAESREESGKSPWNEPLKMPDMPGGKDNSQTLARVGELMGSANQTYQEKGIKDAIPFFEQAHLASKDLDTNTILKEHLQLFVERMQRDRQIAVAERSGENPQPLIDAQDEHTEKQWQKYSEYMLPATVLSNRGLAEINSGRKDLLTDGRLHLGQAVSLRPELQFNQDYAKFVKGAFENYYQQNPDAPATAGSASQEPGASPFQPGQPGYYGSLDGPEALKNPDPDILTEKQLESYTADDVTGPALTAAVIALGLYQGYRQIKNWQARNQAERAENRKGSIDSIPGGDMLAPRDGKPDIPFKYATDRPVAELVQGVDKFLATIPEAEKAQLRQDLASMDRMAPEVSKVLNKLSAKNVNLSGSFDSMTPQDLTRMKGQLQSRGGLSEAEFKSLSDYKQMQESLNQRLYKYNQPLAKAMEINPAEMRLQLTPTLRSAAGRFGLTTGVMELQAQEIFAEKLNPETFGTFKHESRHVEQLRLIMRSTMGDHLQGAELTREARDQIYEKFRRKFPGVNESSFDRGYFDRMMTDLAANTGTEKLSTKERARASGLVKSLNRNVDMELRSFHSRVNKISEYRGVLRTGGAEKFAEATGLTPHNDGQWKYLFGDTLPPEIEEIRRRGIKSGDMMTLDRYLDTHTRDLGRRYIEAYNAFPHEAEASKTGRQATEDAVKFFQETGREIPPGRSNVALDANLRPFDYRLVGSDRAAMIDGMIYDLKNNKDSAGKVIEFLNAKQADGRRNLDIVFGENKPAGIAELSEKGAGSPDQASKTLIEGLEKTKASIEAAAPAVAIPGKETVIPTAKDKLQIAPALLAETTVAKVNDKINQVLPDLAKVPDQAGNRLRNAVFDALGQAGVSDASLTKEGTEIVFSKDAKESSVKYFTGEAGKQTEVTRKGSEFVTASGAAVDAAKVKMQIVLPQSMMTGKAAELTRTVYDALLQKANRGANNAADVAGIDSLVRTALKDHLPMPGRESGKPGGDRIIGELPAQDVTRPVEIQVSDKGVRIAGVERVIPFKEVWQKHVDDLNRTLKEEKAKKQGKDEAKIAELEKTLAREKNFLEVLSNPAHPDYAKTVERAQERMKAFKPTEAQIERMAREKGGGRDVRSRLVALTILAGAFLTGSAFGEGAKEAQADDTGATGSDKPESGAETKAGTSDRSATTREATDGSDVKPDVSERSEKQNLVDLPNAELMRTAMTRIIPQINEAINRKNEGADERNKQALIDESKLRAEWQRGEFGAESRRLWKEAQKFLETDSIRLMQSMDARGMKYPVGAPVGPARSESGSGLKETDEMFRERLRAGQVKADLGFHALQAGDLPTADETTRFINTFIWVGEAGKQYSKAFIQGQATYIDHNIQGFAKMSRTGNLDGWKAPKDASPEELERWQVAAVPWMQTIAHVKDYSERIAAFNAATTTKGTDWPSLSKFFKMTHGLDGKDFSFPDDAIKDANFPGKVLRNADGSVNKIELDLPASLDRTPENIAKMEKLEAWLKKYSPQVDQVSAEIGKAMMDDGHMLLWAEAGDLQTDRKVPGHELRSKNPGLKGDASDVGKFVNVDGTASAGKREQQSEWRVKKVNADGSYELFRSAPNGEKFNLKRYEFTTIACDKDGKPNPKGDYVQVVNREDFLWARDYAYNNWDFLGSIQKAQRVDKPAQVYHKNDFVPVVDDGRVRLLQAKNLDSWASSQEWAKQTGNGAALAVDAGMFAIGVGEARLAWGAAKMSGAVAMRQVVKEGLKATWHIGLGATGFGKQAIVNNFGDAGRTFMHYRHYAIMADLTLQLAPKGFQKGLWDTVWRTKGMPSIMESTAGLNNLTWFDKALRGVNKVYEGGSLVKYTPPIGIFPLVDYYYLADFTNTLAGLDKSKKEEWPKLVDAMLKQGDGYRDSDRPLFLSPDRMTPEDVKRVSALALSDYQDKLVPRAEKGAAADVNGKRAIDLLERSKEALFKPENDPARKKFESDALDVYRNPQATQEDRTAAAFLLLSMRKSDAAGEKLGGASGITVSEATNHLRTMAGSSSSPQVRMAAGDMLLKMARTAEATSISLSGHVRDLEARVQQAPTDNQIAQELAAGKKRLEEAESFKKNINFSSADYVNILTNIVNDRNVPRALRMEAIASPTGPRLAALLQQFRYDVEPHLRNNPDVESRTRQMAELYGRDSAAIEKVLHQIATNAGEDADLRALATRALSASSLDRPTVNGRPLTPGQQIFVGTAGDVNVQSAGVEPRHAAIGLSNDGEMMVRTVDAGDTWILHADGTSTRVGNEWTRLSAGDRVRVGDRENGSDLLLGSERTEALARMGADVKLNRDKQGAIAQEYSQQLLDRLKAKIDPATIGDDNQRTDATVNKYRAALAAIEMGPSLTSGDVNQFNQLVADALAECVQSESPELAANALSRLTAERMASLSFSAIDGLREAALRTAAGSSSDAREVEFKRLLVERFPDIFKQGTDEQKTRARNTLEALLIPGADAVIAKQDPTTNYPLYAAGDPNMRMSALKALAQVDPDKAVEVAKLKLFGGTYNNIKMEADVATVRMAALETLHKIQPTDLGAISLKALKSETDPAILAKLWDVEYQERRPDLDPVRMMREYEALRERLLQRSQPGLLEDGKRVVDAIGSTKNYDIVTRLQSDIFGGYGGDRFSQKAKDARLGMIYMIVHERVNQGAMAHYLEAISTGASPAMAQELAVPLEMTLLSAPHMWAEARSKLLNAYLNLKPVENGVISKDEASMLYATMLENEVNRMPAKGTSDWLKYDREESKWLQLKLLRELSEQPTDKILPIIEALAGDKHPMPEVQAKINELYGQLRGSTELYRQAAEHEARYIKNEKSAGRTPGNDFAKARNNSELADAMGAVLTSKDADAAKVAKALYLGVKLSPLTSAEDPRLLVLRLAARDSNETVRLVAAKLLDKSPDGSDKQRAAFVAADTIKNSPIPALKTEAEALSKEIAARDKQLMDRALAETVVAQRPESETRPQGGEGIDDVRNQRAYERVRRSLISGPRAELTWDWKEWDDFTKKYKFDLLTSSGFHNAQDAAARQVDANRGTLSSIFSWESTKEAERQAARDAVVPKMWEQLNGLISMAMEKGDLDPDGREARKALNYLLLDDALAFYNRDQAKALDVIVDGIERMCKGNSPGRGDMEWVLRSALTQKPDLKLEHKVKLLNALDALGGEKGKLTNENVAGIVALALEQEYRFMPKPGDPAFAPRMEYHKKLLGMMEKYGNRDLSAALNIYIQNHPDQTVRARATQARDAIELRATAGVRALVSDMVADTSGARKFSAIRDEKDPRLPILLETAQNTKLPIEQRNRAAAILLAAENKGVPADARRTASNSFVTNGLTLPDAGSRYTSAIKIIDRTNKQFTGEDRARAIAVLSDLSLRGPAEIRERSEVALAKLSGEEAAQAMKSLLDSAAGINSRGSTEEKARVTRTLDQVLKLYQATGDGAAINGQAQLFRLATMAAGSGNQELTERTDQVITTLRQAPNLIPVASAEDSRLATLKNALKQGSDQVKLTAAIILSSDASAGVNNMVKLEARKELNSQIERMILETRQLESAGAAAPENLAAQWSKLDAILSASGAAEDGYSRSYIRMKQLELAGGKEQELAPIYERLAKLSKDREAPQAASLFEQKAQSTRLISASAKDFQTADAAFKAAQDVAREAATSKQPAKLAEAESKLKAAVQNYSTLAGQDSVFAADALAALGKFYAASGKAAEADDATRKAIAIYEAQAARSISTAQQELPKPKDEFESIRIPGVKVVSVNYSRLAIPNDKGSDITEATSSEYLHKLIDYSLSRGAIHTDALKSAESDLARAISARTGTFGEASLSAAEGYEKMAQLYNRSGQAAKAAGVLKTAVSIYQNYPGMEAKVGAASQQLAQALETTREFQKAEEAYEAGIRAMTKKGAIISQQEVIRHMTNIAEMYKRHGRTDKANYWLQEISRRQRTGGSIGNTRSSILPFG